MCFLMRKIDPGQRMARGLLLGGCCWEGQQTCHWCLGSVMLLGDAVVVKGERILTGEAVNCGCFCQE